MVRQPCGARAVRCGTIYYDIAIIFPDRLKIYGHVFCADELFQINHQKHMDKYLFVLRFPDQIATLMQILYLQFFQLPLGDMDPDQNNPMHASVFL
jgi:hypothetical protein